MAAAATTTTTMAMSIPTTPIAPIPDIDPPIISLDMIRPLNNSTVRRGATPSQRRTMTPTTMAASSRIQPMQAT